MGPMKRPSAAAATAGPKRGRPTAAGAAPTVRAKQDPVLEGKANAIAALVAASGLPESVVQLVNSTIASTLGTVKEERHDFQTRTIAFIEEALKMARDKLEAKLSELATQLTRFEGEKGARTSAAEAAETALAERSQAEEDAKAALAAATEAVAAAKAALALAKQEQSAGDAEAQQAEERKARLDAAVADDFAKLKEGAFTAAVFKSFQKVAKEFGFDGNMVSASQAALKKPPAERGGFDNTVVEQLEGAFAKAAASLADLIANAAPAKEARAAKVSESDAAVTAAQEDEAAKKAALATATAEHKAAVAGKKAADKAVKEYGQDLKRLEADTSLAAGDLEEARATIQAFRELVERTAPPPEPKEAPPAAVVEEATAVEAAPVEA